MEKTKLVHGSGSKRTFATPAKHAELLAQRRKQERKERLIEKWFTIDESDKISVSDLCMSVGFYILLPLMVLAVIAYMAFYF